MSCLGSIEIQKMIKNGILTFADPKHVSPASIDFRLSKYLLHLPSNISIDTLKVSSLPWEEIEIPDDGYILLPYNLYLGSSVERLTLPHNIVAMAEGKSTMGRLGLMVHITAGWIDPGFDGTITLEMVATNPIRIYENLRLGQFTFFEVNGNVATYEGRYQKRQFGSPTPPRDGGLF